MTEPQNVPNPPIDVRGLVDPHELHRLTDVREAAERQEKAKFKKKVEDEQKELYRLFNERHLRPEAAERFSNLVRQAAERGERRVEILRFPSDWCSDSGRAINNVEPDWPETLTGFAKEVYQAFDQWLRPKGYRMQAQIVEYPGGVPGDVALYISW